MSTGQKDQRTDCGEGTPGEGPGAMSSTFSIFAVFFLLSVVLLIWGFGNI